MPTLHWIGKDKVVNHHHDVPFRVLDHKTHFTSGDQPSTPGNKIIHGDNLEALKALLPEYEGKVKCIYIDPPYNTGKDEWKYSDRVDHPQILKWLGEVVGKEGEDLSRHDKWLCMIYPRLKLLHQLLKNNGVIFISIDDNEYQNLLLICDEIFGRRNRAGTIIWNNATDNNPSRIANEHEYIVSYVKESNVAESVWKTSTIASKKLLLQKGKEIVNEFKDEELMQKAYSKWLKSNKRYIWPFEDYKFIDKEGVFTGSRSVHNPGKEGYRYDILHPVTKQPCKQPLMGYRFPESTAERILSEGRFIFGDDENKIVELKVYAKDYRLKLSSVINLDGRKGANEIKSVFESKKVKFKNPKPTELIKELVSFVTSEDDIILDSFAGSGTTAHAVLNLNAEDGGNRKFILIEMEDYAETITAERVRRVMKGYGEGTNAVAGTGGAFDYYELGEPLFLDDSNLNPAVPITELRRYVWYTETRADFPATLDEEDPYLGTYEGTAYWFLYHLEEETTLDYDFLATVTQPAEQYIVYADNCLLSPEYLAEHSIVFKKIPRDLSRH